MNICRVSRAFFPVIDGAARHVWGLGCAQVRRGHRVHLIQPHVDRWGPSVEGLTLIRALTPAQRERTVIAKELPGEAFTAAFRDNLALRYEGIRFGELSSAQQSLLVCLVEIYVGRMRPGHDRIKMEEVQRHLGEMHFAWMGGFDEDSVFYYRLHSPVILIEFDHQRGIVFDNDEPSRNHIHTVIRTPNGNDYGHDLLRQHHERFDHTRGGHAHSHR